MTFRIEHLPDLVPARTRAALAFAAAGVLTLSACSGSEPDSSNVATTTALTLTSLERDAAVGAAIDVRASGCGPRDLFGTGSVISDGLIVTAAHVVAGTESVEVIDTDGDRSTAIVVLFDPDLDIAVLRPASRVGEPRPLRDETARSNEEGVIVLPRLVDGDVDTEVIDVGVLRPVDIKTTDIYLEDDVLRKGFEVTAPIEPGDSGAMVQLPGGGVGIIWARSNEREGRAWAVNLPDELRDPQGREVLREPVDIGPCAN